MSQPSCFLSSGNFTGPFDLLLELAEKQNINLSHVSLSAIVDDYLKFVLEGKIRSGDLAEFIKMASKLIFIKSGILFPLIIEQGSSTNEDLSELKEKLVLFSLFKGRAHYLKSKFGKTPSFSRQKNRNFFAGGNELLQKTKMASLLKKLVREMPEMVDQKISRRILRLEIKSIMVKIKRVFKKERKVSFFDFSKNMDKMEVAVTFLALLEIARKMETNLSQAKWADDICLEN